MAREPACDEDCTADEELGHASFAFLGKCGSTDIYLFVCLLLMIQA